MDSALAVGEVRGRSIMNIGKIHNDPFSAGDAQEDDPGPATGRIYTGYRYDGCHFNERGRRKAAEAWYETLLKSGDLPDRAIR